MHYFDTIVKVCNYFKLKLKSLTINKIFQKPPYLKSMILN